MPEIRKSSKVIYIAIIYVYSYTYTLHQLTQSFPLISTPALIWALTLFKSPLLAALHSPLMENYSDTYTMEHNTMYLKITYLLYA